jgi:glycosyltransferase involved in cell wall biosynthesis
MNDSAPQIALSVLIATHNNCRRLGVTLANIACCRSPGVPWELVLVANGCSDDTASVAREAAPSLPLVYCELSRPGVSRAKNAGLETTRGRLIVCTDDDVRPCRDWLVVYWNAYQELGQSWFYGGPLVSEFEDSHQPSPALLRRAGISITGWHGGPACREIAPTGHFVGANWAFPADVIRRVGGYRERLGLDASLGRRRVGEEFDLLDRMRSLGLRGIYLPSAEVHHFVPKSKCNLRHVGDNARACGLHSVRSRRYTYLLQRMPKLEARLGPPDSSIFSVLRVLWATLACGVELAWARLTSHEHHEPHVSLQYCLGRLEGHFEIFAGWLSEIGRRSGRQRPR